MSGGAKPLAGGAHPLLYHLCSELREIRRPGRPHATFLGVQDGGADAVRPSVTDDRHPFGHPQ
jgi:hypothetical protein